MPVATRVNVLLQKKRRDTDCEVPVKVTFEALAHPNRSNDNVRLIWGANYVRVRLVREIKDLGDFLVGKFGLQNEDAVRSEDPR